RDLHSFPTRRSSDLLAPQALCLRPLCGLSIHIFVDLLNLTSVLYFATPSSLKGQPASFTPTTRTLKMKSTKCVECGFVGWSDETCKACGAPLGQRSHDLPSSTPVYSSDYYDQSEP